MTTDLAEINVRLQLAAAGLDDGPDAADLAADRAVELIEGHKPAISNGTSTKANKPQPPPPHDADFPVASEQVDDDYDRWEAARAAGWDCESDEPMPDVKKSQLGNIHTDNGEDIPASQVGKTHNGRPPVTRRIDYPHDLPEDKGPRFKTYTSRELAAAEFKTEYLIDNVLVAGQHLIIAGARKTLKTNILVDLGISLSCGGWFLQKFKVNRPIRVGIMSGESGDSTIQETANRVCRSKGIELADLSNLVWTFDLPQFGNIKDEGRLEKWITSHELAFCVVDPAYLAMPLGDDAGNLFKVGEKLQTVTNVSKATGCTMAICHHARKRRKGDQTYDALELDDIAWAGFQEWARQWLLLGRREGYDPANGGAHKLWLSSGGSAGHSGLWGVDIEEGIRSDPGGRRWDVTVLKGSEVIQALDDARDGEKTRRSERQLASDVEKVRTAMNRIPDDGDTLKNIAAVARISNARCTAALAELVEDGAIEHCEVTKSNKQVYPGYRTTGTHRDSVGQHRDNPTESHSGTNPL